MNENTVMNHYVAASEEIHKFVLEIMHRKSTVYQKWTLLCEFSIFVHFSIVGQLLSAKYGVSQSNTHLKNVCFQESYPVMVNS